MVDIGMWERGSYPAIQEGRDVNLDILCRLPAVHTVRSGKDHGVGLNQSLTEFHG
jgi:hypothetical protein